MKFVKKIIGIQLILLSLVACSSTIQVVSESIDQPGDISMASTYRWDDSSLSGIAPGEAISSDFSNAIRDEIEKVMATLGYKMVADDSAEMTLSFRVTIKEGVNTSLTEIPFYEENYTSPYGIKWRFGGEEKPVVTESAAPPVELSYYKEGTLHIAAFDSDKHMSWHTSAQKVIDDTHSPNEHEQVLRRTVQVMMQKFPASATKNQ